MGPRSLPARPEVPDVAAQLRALIIAKQTQNSPVAALVVGGKYFRSLAALMSAQAGHLFIPRIFDTIPIYAVDADVMGAVYDNAEALQFSLSRLTPL